MPIDAEGQGGDAAAEADAEMLDADRTLEPPPPPDAPPPPLPGAIPCPFCSRYRTKSSVRGLFQHMNCAHAGQRITEEAVGFLKCPLECGWL